MSEPPLSSFIYLWYLNECTVTEKTASFHGGPFPIASLNLPRPGRWAVRLPNRMAVFFAIPTLKSYFLPTIHTCFWTSSEKDCLNQPQMPAHLKMQKLKKKLCKTSWKPKILWLQNLHLPNFSKGPSHPNSPSPETSCFSNTCCGHCINARAAAKCAFGAWQHFSDFQKMHQQHPISKPSKESQV